MDFISLFAGIGGFDLGLERAGLRCVAQVEWDKAAAAVLKNHYPTVQRFGDVRDVGKRNLPAVDLVVGGFPCQDVSVAGRRAGLAGERSGLWFEFHRILTEVKPRIAVIENVPGLLSSNGGRDFAVILRGLEECGYRVAWRTLDAQYFGVAQRRRRVFIVASLGDGSCAEILFERESRAGDIESRIEERQGTPSEIEASSFSDSGPGYWRQGIGSLRNRASGKESNLITVGTLSASAGRNRGLGLENETDLLIAESIDARSSRSNGDISGTLQAKSNGGYSLNYTNAVAIHAATGQDISPSLTSEGHDSGEDGRGRHAFAVYRQGVRRLTPTECERLQGFPDGWTAVNNQSDSVRYRQLGNAVCVNVSEWIGRRIAKYA